MKRYLQTTVTFFILIFTCSLNAQFLQQGDKLIGNDASGNSFQGSSVALSYDGSTAIVGGSSDNSLTGAAWIYLRQYGQWVQQGSKLVGSGASGCAQQGYSVDISADGNTAILGGVADNNSIGAAWIFMRQGGAWKQQGSKLTGTGAAGTFVSQGNSVSISSDGNTVIIGGPNDDYGKGAAWIFVRSNGVWCQQGTKLTGAGALGNASFGRSVAISSDGNTALIGGNTDNYGRGAAWLFIRQNGAWHQQCKVTASDGSALSGMGFSADLSMDGSTAIIGGNGDNGKTGAAWIFRRQDGCWIQQGSKLVGTGSAGASHQGWSVSISTEKNTAVVGGSNDDGGKGALWVYSKINGTWMQQDGKLVGTGASGNAGQGWSTAISADGSTIITGGIYDNGAKGAAWIFTRATSLILATSGEGGIISPSGYVVVNYGQNQTFTISPNSGYHISDVKVDDVSKGAIEKYTFENVRQNHFITASFTLNAAPEAPIPVISYPTGGITVYTRNPLVCWYITGYFPGAKYHLQVSESADFSTIIFQKDDIDAIYAEVQGLNSGKTYYTRVRIKTPGGLYGYYSTVASFSVSAQSWVKSAESASAAPSERLISANYPGGILQKDNIIPKDYALRQNYPNPFNPSTTVEFSLPKDEMVKLAVYDILGREVKIVLNENLAAGNYKVTIKGEELSSGAYIYRIITPSLSIAKKMLLQK